MNSETLDKEFRPRSSQMTACDINWLCWTSGIDLVKHGATCSMTANVAESACQVTMNLEAQT